MAPQDAWITFLQMILNHSAAWPIFKVRVARAQHETAGRRFAAEKEERVFVYDS